MDISIVIVNYNVREFLRGALESIRRSLANGNLTGEIMVVDNASIDGSQEMVRRDFPDVKLYDLPKNIGFGRANNIAMRDAKGDYILVVNPDTILGEDTLGVMIDFMKSHPECGVSGCKLLNADGSFQVSCRRGFPSPWASFTKLFGLASIFPNSPLFAQYNLTYLPVDETYEIDALAGAFMLLSREAFEKTGGFDEDFFMYGEDIDLSYRIKKAGLNVYYVHSTSTVHFKGESTRRSVLNEVKVFYEAMHTFVAKHYGASPLFNGLLRLGIFLRSTLAFFKKYRGAIILAAADLFAVFAAIFGISRFVIGSWFGLPKVDYPWVFIISPIVVITVLSIVGAYLPENRRKARPVILAMPVILIVISSFTYFFKEFTASRSLVLELTAVLTVLLVLVRSVFRFIDRFRYGGEGSAKPVLRRTLIAGTGSEALRIAGLLRSSGFSRRYDLTGFIGKDLSDIRTEPMPGLQILGDLRMLDRVIREHNINQVIFPSDAFSYSDMLLAMQRVSNDLDTQEVSFNVVPQATDVLLSRSKIEVISPPDAETSFAVMPLEYNIQKISHRLAKRLFDIFIGVLAFPVVSLFALFRNSSSEETTLSALKDVLKGNRSLVGIRPTGETSPRLAKTGMMSLADITYPASPGIARNEDIEQVNLYYARNHTIGMDIEILLRSVFGRRSR
jgi:GT2 family glycosyltransferase